MFLCYFVIEHLFLFAEVSSTFLCWLDVISIDDIVPLRTCWLGLVKSGICDNKFNSILMPCVFDDEVIAIEVLPPILFRCPSGNSSSRNVVCATRISAKMGKRSLNRTWYELSIFCGTT
ncbi:hypothetical protein AVEN_115282-1 [Araneus ventricosus]|uniref:Secreted protein n=1 Tax=Araneus ventricosus TaxID=182803 RepID=A0A4Y1ZXX0_ARAVE|nr:hypothetical protein AVEN_115282-1 [Araneus ventricosus]